MQTLVYSLCWSVEQLCWLPSMGGGTSDGVPYFSVSECTHQGLNSMQIQDDMPKFKTFWFKRIVKWSQLWKHSWCSWKSLEDIILLWTDLLYGPIYIVPKRKHIFCALYPNSWNRSPKWTIKFPLTPASHNYVLYCPFQWSLAILWQIFLNSSACYQLLLYFQSVKLTSWSVSWIQLSVVSS